MPYILIIPGLIILFFIWSYIEHKILVVSEYTVQSEAVGKDLCGLTFAVVADLHNASFGKNGAGLVEKILAQKPEFVIIAGDMINKRKHCYPAKALDFIREISEHYPVYYALGNHEQYFEELKDIIYDDDFIQDEKNARLVRFYEEWVAYKDELKKLGVYLLDNCSIELMYKESRLAITGLSLGSGYYDRKNRQRPDKDTIASLAGNRSREGFQILIAHNPLFFPEYVSWGADLVLSGHMHGGLVRLPIIGGIISPLFRLFPKYDAGLFNENGHFMIISRGLGSHSNMPRFLNPPELVTVKLLGR